MKPSDLRHCPVCAGPLELRAAGHPPSEHPVCLGCGFVLWQNPKPSVEALIVRGENQDAEVLLGRLGMGPRKGRWDAPGGFLNLGDEPEAALVRECQREMGVTVRVRELIGAFPDVFAGSEILALYYWCELRFGQARPADVIDGVAWFPLAAPPEMAFLSGERAIRALQERLIGGRDG